ncbi:MAG TPA: CAP domain-containing protein [Steroidobacteraceae bacterium]|nr:CAP domain-containing protein [Steroidobacteraceae bacterium]
MNEARRQKRRCGFKRFEPSPPLAASATLQRAAKIQAEDMARRGVMEHAGGDGSTPAERATRAGYAWRTVGENVAAGQSTPEQVVEEWLGSPRHCANIMSPDYTEMGVAVASSAAGVYWAQVFGAPAP